MAIRADVDDMVAFLNTLAKIDPVGMGRLLAARVQCNSSIADHPSVQVGTANELKLKDLPPDTYCWGMLGLLNGYFGTYDVGPKRGYGPITAIVEDDGSCRCFVRTDLVGP